MKKKTAFQKGTFESHTNCTIQQSFTSDYRPQATNSNSSSMSLTELSMPRVRSMMKKNIAKKVEPGRVQMASG